MSGHSQSPIRRAQGYLVALVESGALTLARAEEAYWQIRCRHGGRGRPSLRPLLAYRQPAGLRPAAGLPGRLASRDAYFCRGYLFALVERGAIRYDLAVAVMRELDVRRGRPWLADFPRWQSHPLDPRGSLVAICRER